MGETSGGTDDAQAAPEPGDSPPSRGFFGRIFDAFSPSDETQPGQSAGEAPRPPASHGIGNLRRLRVDDVAVPKAEIVAVPVNIALDDLIRTFRESGFSRLPVFKGTLDSPQGLIHLKDLALQYAFAESKPRFNLRKMLRPLLFAPPSMPIGVLLQKMQSQRIHMALVIDEYGGVDGLLTIEDLIEQVVGEIADEHDDEESDLWTLEKPGQYLVQARTSLEDFEAEAGIRLADAGDAEEIDTLGGLIFMHLGRVPARGEVLTLENGTEVDVVDADPRRVKKLRVRLPAAG